MMRYLADLTTTIVFAFPSVLHPTGVFLVSTSVIKEDDATLELFNLLSSILDGEVEELCTFSQPSAKMLTSVDTVFVD